MILSVTALPSALGRHSDLVLVFERQRVWGQPEYLAEWTEAWVFGEVSWRMKVGLLPWWTAPSSGTARASLSLLPVSIPSCIFSGNTVVSSERSWGHTEHREWNGEQGTKGCGSDSSRKVPDPA